MSKSRDIADSAATINYIDGLTSDAQTQLDAKATLDGSPTFTGTVTATAFSGDGSGLTGVDSLPSQTGNAGEFLTTDGTDASWTPLSTSPSLEAIASGTLANGDTVIVNSDGTVSAISGSSPTAFTSVGVSQTSTTFDSNSNKLIVCYSDPSNGYGTAVVGTVSGISISFGTPVVFASSNTSIYLDSACFDSNENKVVIAYRDWTLSNYGRAVVGTVSGTSISFGSPVTFQASQSLYNVSVFDPSTNKVVISFSESGANIAYLIVGTVSGTSISFGSALNFDFTRDTSLVFDSNSNKIVLCYKDNGNSDFGTSIVATVSGTSITVGTPVVFNSSSSQYISAAFDSNQNKVLVAFRDGGNSNYGTSAVGTVSGTSISYGSKVVFNPYLTSYISAAYDVFRNKMVISYSGLGTSPLNRGSAIDGSISGTSITYESEKYFTSNVIVTSSLEYDSNSQKLVIFYGDNGGSPANLGTSIVWTGSLTNLESTNYIGISDAAYTNGQTAKIQIVGSVDDAQSGLTAGQKYYVQIDGTLSLIADDPSVVAGTAVSATKLIIKG